ncbi:MAG: hypothetical protein ACE5JG_06085 [Planctomycetota bacterium]
MFENLKALEKARGISASEKRHLAILIGVLVVLLLGTVFLLMRTNPPEPRAEQPSLPVADEPTQVFGAGKGGPSFDADTLALLKDATVEQRRTPRPEPLGYLLAEAKQNPAVWSYRDRLARIDADLGEELQETPAAWRGVILSFRGRLEVPIEEQDLAAAWGTTAVDVEKVWHGRLLIEGRPDHRLHFLSPTEPTWTDPEDPTPNPPTPPLREGWVRGRGIFVQRLLAPGAAGAGEVSALLFVATALERDYQRREIATLQDCELHKIEDDPVRGRAILDRPFPLQLARLLRYAEARAGAKGKPLREKEGLTPDTIDAKKTYEELMAHPDRFRARYFGGLGTVMVEHTVRRAPPNDAGMRETGTVWILTDKQRLLRAHTPPALRVDLPKGTRVLYEGFFYKGSAYPTQAGTWRRAPVLVLTRLDRVLPPESNPLSELIFAGAFGAGLLLLIWFIVREDKTKRAYRRGRAHRSRVGT